MKKPSPAKAFVLAAAVVTVFGLAACTGNNNSAADPDSFTPVSIKAVSLADVIYDDAGNLLLDYSLDDIEVSGGGEGASQAIAEAYNRQYKATQDEDMQLYIEAAEGTLEMISDGEKEFYSGSCFHRSVAAARSDNAVFSMRIDFEQNYAGAAHGIAFRKGMTFDAVTGRQLTIDELSAKDADLAAAAAQKAEEWIMSSEYVNAVTCDDVDAAVYQLLTEYDQWYLTDTGLMMICNPYDVTAYAAGMLEIELSYDELSGLMSEEYIKEN